MKSSLFIGKNAKKRQKTGDCQPQNAKFLGDFADLAP
jgi:hypothetical protein